MAQTASLDQEILQVESDLAQLHQDLSDLDERGIYRVQLDNGQTLEAEITGDELRFDNDALMQSMGIQAQAGDDKIENDTPPVKKYLPYALIGGGVIVVLFVLTMVLGRMAHSNKGTQSSPAVVETTPMPTATITPTPAPTVTPTPPLIPDDFIERAPIMLFFPALGLQWDVSKGDWTASDNNTLELAEEGDKIRYYKSFVGVGNTVLGGNGSTPDDPFYAMRSADINDIIRVKDRAGRIFTYRLLPFGGDRVERWITPGDIWVADPTDYIALTMIIRVDNQRMALRGKLYAVNFNDD